VEVAGNSVGMNLQDLYNPAFQLFSRQHSAVVGTGVGLCLVQRIVRSIGEQETIESPLQEGTMFIVLWKAS
jgi:light-regulated signal transduction histidine kinase (bacteriophytochrome)